MATRSAIGRANSDGTVTAIYCHWDGYPECVGRTLVRHYTDEDKINQLIELGDLSVLGSEIGKKHDFDARYGHNDQRANWCLAYGRDRGEEETVSRPFANKEEFVSTMMQSGCEYFYLWTTGHWQMRGAGWSVLDLEEMEDKLVDTGSN